MKRLLLCVPLLLFTMAIGPCAGKRLGNLDAGTDGSAAGSGGKIGTTGTGGMTGTTGTGGVTGATGTGGTISTGGATGTGGTTGTGGATDTGGSTGTGGTGGDCPDTRITQAEALALYTAFANLAPSITFVVEEANVPNLWEVLRVQVFNQSRPGSLSTGAFTYHRCTIREFGVGAGSQGVLSGLVRGTAFYYSYGWGSGFYRSHIGRITVAQTGLGFLETGGFSHDGAPPPVMVRQAADQIIVEFGTPAGFNAWTNPMPLGTLMDTGDRLVVIDAAGQEIAPEFPPAP